MIFVDEARISVKGGNGGQGCESFYQERYMRYRRPNGGDGGRVATAEQPQAAKPVEEKKVEPEVMETMPAVKPSDSPGPLTDSQDLDKSGPSESGPLFYRYKDANGVIYITREKPAHGEYEVLRR